MASAKQAKHVAYLGRVIPREGFRAFVYGFDNTEKCVDSWAEFEHEIASGEWFATKADVPAKKTDKGRK